MNLKQRAETLGWTDVHGGPEEGGVYWRGVNPHNGAVEPIPESILWTKKDRGNHWRLNSEDGKHVDVYGFDGSQADRILQFLNENL